MKPVFRVGFILHAWNLYIYDNGVLVYRKEWKT